MQLTNCNDLVLCLGDFNAETGLARNPPSVVGPYGMTTPNDFWTFASVLICAFVALGIVVKTLTDSPGCQMITKWQRRLITYW